MRQSSAESLQRTVCSPICTPFSSLTASFSPATSPPTETVPTNRFHRPQTYELCSRLPGVFVSPILERAPDGLSRVPFPSLIEYLGFTVFASLAYVYIGGQRQRSTRVLRDQTDRETTVRRTLAVVPIHSEVNRLADPNRGSRNHRAHSRRRLPPVALSGAQQIST